LRNMLSRRQLQGFVRAPLDCNSHALFLWQKRAGAANGKPSSFRDTKLHSLHVSAAR
jgi:hypothetical protein